MLVETSLVDTLLDEIVDSYGHLGLRRVARAVEDAVADLHGSVSAEALPEMATRLAIHRLNNSTGGTGVM